LLSWDSLASSVGPGSCGFGRCGSADSELVGSSCGLVFVAKSGTNLVNGLSTVRRRVGGLGVFWVGVDLTSRVGALVC